VLRHEQHTLGVAGVDGQSDVQVGEDDDVVERDEQQACLVWFYSSGGNGWKLIRRTNYEKCTGIPMAPGHVDTPYGSLTNRGSWGVV
jgi:hypothetical protein